MGFFQIFKKHEPEFIKLPQPDNSIPFFETIKIESEKYWGETTINNNVYGFQIQPESKWKPGLDDHALLEFEQALGFKFPLSLWNFYKTMNGLTKPGINIYGNSGTPEAFRPVFYSYPEDLDIIDAYINGVLEANNITKDDLVNQGISRIFPVFSHRFILIDAPVNPILSMYRDDIIYWADNLSKLLATEIFTNIYNAWDYESKTENCPEIKFWLD
ncbi:MAG: SMI1/KNR4 family protein [Mucilaginibacter sp.]|nr:SMI1/KNR4 family protein [Mucilaginibacter sp.]